MTRREVSSVFNSWRWTCHRCRARKDLRFERPHPTLDRTFSNSRKYSADIQIHAAPEINLDQPISSVPARILPASASYFTGSPNFNDDFLKIQGLVKRHEFLPTLSPDQAPKVAWMKLSQYRTQIGEDVPASKYSKVLALLTRLNRIHPQLQPAEVKKVMDGFRRPGSEEAPRPKPGKIDSRGRAIGVGRRKESSARVFLIEGTGEVLINGKSIVQAFPRLHDRESALWALKTTERLDKYNVYALVQGGGITGQAESITLAVAKALLVHEPALKPALRRGEFPKTRDLVSLLTFVSAGCVTRDPRRVERKKPGRLKARKKPAWVKR